MHETDIRQSAALAIANGLTYRQTAETLGIGTRTVERWAAEDPGFRSLVERERAERRARLERLCDRALEGLREMAESEETPGYVRRQCWSDILLHYAKERDRELSEEDAAVDAELRRRGLLP